MAVQILLDEGQRKAYYSTLAQFQAEREVYMEEIMRLDALIASIKRKLGESAEGSTQSQFSPNAHHQRWPTPPERGPYAGLSVRNAIRSLFLSNPECRLRTSDVTRMLLEGGLKIGAQKPDQAVSAALSVMKTSKGEVGWENGEWFLTQPVIAKSGDGQFLLVETSTSAATPESSDEN